MHSHLTEGSFKTLILVLQNQDKGRAGLSDSQRGEMLSTGPPGLRETSTAQEQNGARMLSEPDLFRGLEANGKGPCGMLKV